MHLVDVATGMQLKSMGQGATCVPFVYQKNTQKMTLYKGEDALATRRAVAKALNPSLITALQRPRRATDKPNWAPMQQLYNAGLSNDPVSGMPVFDPSACAPALLTALWRGFCGVADTINTKQMGQTDEALDELQMRLHEHAAQLRETEPCSSRLRRSDGTPAKQLCPSARSLSDEDAEQCADGDAVCGPAKRARRSVRTIADSDEDNESSGAGDPSAATGCGLTGLRGGGDNALDNVDSPADSSDDVKFALLSLSDSEEEESYQPTLCVIGKVPPCAPCKRRRCTATCPRCIMNEEMAVLPLKQASLLAPLRGGGDAAIDADSSRRGRPAGGSRDWLLRPRRRVAMRSTFPLLEARFPRVWFCCQFHVPFRLAWVVYPRTRVAGHRFVVYPLEFARSVFRMAVAPRAGMVVQCAARRYLRRRRLARITLQRAARHHLYRPSGLMWLKLMKIWKTRTVEKVAPRRRSPRGRASAVCIAPLRGGGDAALDSDDPSGGASSAAHGRNATLLARLHPLPGDAHLTFDEASYRCSTSNHGPSLAFR